jgi:dienelactone hydrolase
MLSDNRNRKSNFCILIEGFYSILPAVVLSLALTGCGTTSYLADMSYMKNYHVEQINTPDPSADGPYSYRTYFYGSGNDKHRKEYGQNVDFKTEPVDASPFMDIYDGMPRYWGFDFDSLPLNGRVWFPDGDGPFPLVLIVHGNHNMKSFSDPGYEYLGKMLASRGFIAVSVDENFLNQKFDGENGARAFLLLEHLNVWDTWNQTEGHPFKGKVDMGRIALIGHSRGGESVAHAAAFNRLERYPDDANVRLGYNFNIRSVIAIAPCDEQYKPAGHSTALENVNYLVIQGGHDADVSTFLGLRQFNRVYFTDDHFWCKSAVYVYRANHNQFNTAWGKSDADAPDSWFLNDKPIMDAESQQKVAKVLISAFLEATLNNRDEYLPMFKDIRKAAKWLPEDIYINRYEDSNFIIVADFEEDFDVTTTTIPGGRLDGENLLTWKEAYVPYRTKGDSTQENSAVVLEWAKKKNDKDPNSHDVASYTVTLSPEIVKELELSRNMNIVFSIGAGDDEQLEPLDLTIELCDSEGHCAALPLSSVGPVPPALPVRLAKWKWLEEKSIQTLSERIMQTYEMPIQSFVEKNSLLDPSRLENIRFIFDRSDNGIIMLDDIGFSK